MGLEVLAVAEAAGRGEDPLDLRVQALGRRVRDAVVQVRENVREVSLEHPRLLDHGLEPRVRGPEVPPAEEATGRRVVRDYVAARRGRITLERLPGYAPELNPIQYIWGYWKQHELPNLCPK